MLDSGPMANPSPERIDVREHIQETARLLFAEHGPEAVTMAEVAQAAGVARATVEEGMTPCRTYAEGK